VPRKAKGTGLKAGHCKTRQELRCQERRCRTALAC